MTHVLDPGDVAQVLAAGSPYDRPVAEPARFTGLAEEAYPVELGEDPLRGPVLVRCRSERIEPRDASAGSSPRRAAMDTRLELTRAPGVMP